MKNTARKKEYNINPSELRDHKGFVSLTFAEKSIYRAILDLLWEEESQFSCQYDLDYVAEKIGVSISDVEKFFAIMDSQLEPLISQTFCFENGMIIESPQLKIQIAEFRVEIELNEKLTRELNEKAIKSTMSSRLAREFKEEDVTVGYKSKSEQDLSCYSGWLPTINFDRTGQVFYVRNHLIEELVSEYPAVDVKAEIEKIFVWLCGSSNRRKTHARMNKYIRDWLYRCATDYFKNKNENSLADFELAINDFSSELIADIAV
ncbi:hypothetical protein D3C87_351950 [compost metagenome]